MPIRMAFNKENETICFARKHATGCCRLFPPENCHVCSFHLDEPFFSLITRMRKKDMTSSFGYVKVNYRFLFNDLKWSWWGGVLKLHFLYQQRSDFLVIDWSKRGFGDKKLGEKLNLAPLSAALCHPVPPEFAVSEDIRPFNQNFLSSPKNKGIIVLAL